MTYWDTQYHSIDSFSKNKNVLRNYLFEHHYMNLEYNIFDYISTANFWDELKSLHKFLKLIDEAIKMSENNGFNLEMIIQRWDDILMHLTRMKKNFPFLDDFLKKDDIFASRYQRQVLFIHIIVFYLSLINHNTEIDSNNECRI